MAGSKGIKKKQKHSTHSKLPNVAPNKMPINQAERVSVKPISQSGAVVGLDISTTDKFKKCLSSSTPITKSQKGGDDVMSLAELLLGVRLKCGLNRHQMAKLLDLPATTIQGLELGILNLSHLL